jgi:hypothetical protein
MKLSPGIQKLYEKAARAEKAARKPRKKKRAAPKRRRKAAKKRATSRRRKTTKKRATSRRRTSKKRSRSRSTRPAANPGRRAAGGNSGASAKFGSKRRRAIRKGASARAQAAEVEARMALIEAEEAAQASGTGNGALREAERRYQRALRGEERAADIRRGLGPRGFRRVL